MISKKCVSAIAITAFMMLSSVLVLISQNATAASWLTTSDSDFNGGNFFAGTGFGSELHGSGASAYVQNKKDMSNWIEKLPGTNTGPRTSFGFTNDSAEGRFILFGGINGSSQWRNDTWEYNYAAENWEKICNDGACGPPKRMAPSMAYDNNSKVAVMYGGLDDQARALNDTWEYDIITNMWTNRTPMITPRGLTAHKMVYDAKDKRVILVGRGTSSMEVWAYDAAAHLWANRNAIGGPSQRTGYALGYSYQPNHQRVVLFGGAEVMTLYNETWEYNYASNSWSQVNPTDKPSARAGASMTYNFKQSLAGLILWGGGSWTTETWRYNWTGSNPTWIQVLTTTAPTPPRVNHGLAYDPGHDALMIYGGEPSGGPKLNDTWFFEAGYRLEGRYYSKFFNTFTTATQWQYIFWNQTPANVPPNTQMRFQAEANSVCDDAALPNFVGPSGTSGSYYTFTGQGLWVGLNGYKCLRWLADMITFDPSTAPRLEDVTIIYNATTPKPKVDTHSPAIPGSPIDSHIYINFTVPMDPSNVWVGITPNVTKDSPIWRGGNSMLEITHNSQNFLEAHRYDVCVWGADIKGQTLDYVDGKFCWFFTTRGTQPYITNTTPWSGQIDAPLTQNVVITFSEPMDTSTCWPYVTIDNGAVFTSHQWSVGDTVLTMNHSVQFNQFTIYTVDVPLDASKPCTDKSSMLLTYGPTALPWSFTTLATSPFITSTDPTHRQPDVATNQAIAATFSRDMDHNKFHFTFKEWDQATASWKNWTGTFNAPSWSGRTVTLSHATAFKTCWPYRVQIWADDLTGASLITNPKVANPWKFETGSSCGPFMMKTIPYDGEQEIPLWKNVTIYWYVTPPDTGGMDPSFFTFSLKDGYGNELKTHFTPNWQGMGPNYVELLHPAYQFDPCQDYTVKVLTAKDNAGKNFVPGPAENPFTFRTIMSSCPPIITWTQPANGTLNAPLNQDIKIKFSEPMDTSSLNMNIRPNVTTYAPTWAEADTNVTFTHDVFTMCTWYNVTVNARNKSGGFLGRGPVPNPFMFRAYCPPNGTYIVSTYPANGQTGIPLTASIWVNFSDPMDTTSLLFTLVPSAGTPSYAWSNGDMTVRIDHSSPYVECDFYTARVVTARNKTGGDLVGGGVPNPWTFRAFCIAPYIVSTIPVNTATDVGLGDSIQIIFSEPMDQTSLIFNTVPALTYTQQWQNGQTVLLVHSTPFTICTDYTATAVSARDLDNVNLVPGPVPNPWTFKSTCQFQLRGLVVHREAPNVRLTWTSDPAVLYYNVFHSNGRTAQWSLWTMIANVSTNFYVHTNAISDMQNHFYIVRGFKPGGWSSNSTMGALWHASFTPNVGRPGAYWFSIPYNSIYKRASGISTELGYLKINLVAKFDAAKQQTVTWYYFHGFWRGTDFSIAAGEGLMVGIVSNFDWAINGTDRTSPLTFNFRLQARTNLNWIGLPYTGSIATASQLVTSIAGGIGPGMDTKIIAVGKWIYSSQTSEVYAYTPTGWGGTNFIIGPGDGIWIEIVSTFAWTPPLITPEVP